MRLWNEVKEFYKSTGPLYLLLTVLLSLAIGWLASMLIHTW